MAYKRKLCINCVTALGSRGYTLILKKNLKYGLVFQQSFDILSWLHYSDLGLDYLGIPLELLRSDTLLQQEKGICCISHGLLNPKLHLATKPISLVVSSTLWLWHRGGGRVASRAPPMLNSSHIPAVAQHWGLGVSSSQGNHHLPPLVFAGKFALETSSPLQLKT